MLAALVTSMRASFIGLPASSAISRANSSSRDSRMFAAPINTAPRDAGSVVFQSGKAPEAASIALSVSALSDFGVVPRTSDGLDGFTISEVSPESAGTHSPPIKFWDSICDSIKSFLLEKRLDLFSTRSSPILWAHLVLESEFSDRDPHHVTRPQSEVVFGNDPRPRHQEGTSRKGELLPQILRELLRGTLHLRGIHLFLEDALATTPYLQVDGEISHGIRATENDARTQRARPVVDLGLRKIQGVLSLDVARGDVVTGGVTDHLHPAVDDHDELGLGYVPVAVFAHAHPALVSHDPPAGSLEEQLRPLGDVDPLVSVCVGRFGLPRIPALQVCHPARPDLVPGLYGGQDGISRRLFERMLFDKPPYFRGFYREQPPQREIRWQVASVQRPARAPGRLVAGEIHCVPASFLDRYNLP